MPTLITGASGFIGMRLAVALGARRDVVCLSRRKVALDSPSLAGSFHSFEDLRQLDRFDIDCVVHLAAVTGGCSEEDGLAINVQGTRRLLRYLVDRGCRRFVLASSIAATGCLSRDFVPLRLPIPDDHPCLAVDAYGTSKALMEEVARYFHRALPDTDLTLMRFGSVVDAETWSPAPVHVGTPLRIPFALLARVAVSDVVEAVTRAVAAPHRPGARVYNVAGPDATCDDPVADVLRAACGERLQPLDLSAYEAPGHEYDPIYAMERIAADLGFVPQVSTRPGRFK